MLRFDDKVNDMDFFLKLRLTSKGPNSLGGKNDNNISAKYRSIHPSFIGKIDLNVCGTSDPGTSRLATPFCETDGLYFENTHEPENFKYDFDKEIYKSLEDECDCIIINPPLESSSEYYDFVYNTSKFNKELTLKRIKRRRPGYYYIDINLPEEFKSYE